MRCPNCGDGATGVSVTGPGVPATVSPCGCEVAPSEVPLGGGAA